MKKILIGIGDSKFADHAAKYGFELAHQLKASVGLIHIVEPIVAAPNTVSDATVGLTLDNTAEMVTPELMNIEQEISRKVLDAAVKKYGENQQISTFIEYGDTADGILNCATQFGADLIVIGTHSRSGIDRFIMGSVAEHVVRYSDVPVLVVPFKEAH